MNLVVGHKVDILIITALAEELESICGYLRCEEKSYSADSALTYHHSSVSSLHNTMHYSVATTCLFGMGNPDSGVLASGAIRDLNPSYIIMFGIAGGIRSRVSLGDVIVSTRIFYYEQAKLRPTSVETRPYTFMADAILRNRLEDYASRVKKDYSVKFGPFAIGEKIVADDATVASFQLYEPKLLGIEMESFGVATAANHATTRPRFIAIRGVSDHADEQKDDNWRQIALQNAAEFLVSFLECGTLPQHPASPSHNLFADTFIAIHHLSLYRQPSIQSSLLPHLSEYTSTVVREVTIDQTEFFRNDTLLDPRKAFRKQQNFKRRF